MIGLSTQLFDANGVFVFYDKDIIQEDSTENQVIRRISKSRTLDPGVFIDDSGYIPGDNDIKMTISSIDFTIYQNLMNVFKYHPFVILTTSVGNFLCVPSTLRMSNGNAVMEFSTKDNA